VIDAQKGSSADASSQASQIATFRSGSADQDRRIGDARIWKQFDRNARNQPPGAAL